MSWTGTGFLYGVQADQGQANFLVTNKHVFAGEEGITGTGVNIRLIASGNDEQPDLGRPTAVTVQWQGTADDYAVHPDPAVDVAVIPFQFIHEAMERAQGGPFFRSIGEDVVLSQEGLATQATDLEDVVFVGYPSGIYDSPITLGIQNRIVFAGVLASVHTRPRVGTVVEVPTALATLSMEHLGLGIVYKPWTIDACIDARLEKAGLRRTGGRDVSRRDWIRGGPGIVRGCPPAEASARQTSRRNDGPATEAALAMLLPSAAEAWDRHILVLHGLGFRHGPSLPH